MLKVITLLMGICFLIDAKSTEKESSAEDDSFKVFEQQGFTKDAQGYIIKPPYPKIELPPKEDGETPYDNKAIIHYLKVIPPELIHRDKMLINEQFEFIKKDNDWVWITRPNLLKEAPNMCSPEEPFHPSIQETFNSFKPHIFPNLTETLIQETKTELYLLSKKAIQNYISNLENLACLGDNAFSTGYLKSFVKVLIWNRILLAQETINKLFDDKFMPNPAQYSLENLQILIAHTQLSKITKDHIDHLWIDYDVCPSKYLYLYPKSRPWQDQKERRSFKFATLLKKIFDPTVNRLIHPDAEFDEIFKVLTLSYPGEQ